MRAAAIILLVLLAVQAAAGQEIPEARWGHVFAYFPPTDTFVLFGGASERGNYRDDTWVWNGHSWQQLDGHGPSARGFAAAAYDPLRKVLFLHGGRGNERVTHNDLWEWNGSVWLQREAAGPFSSDHHEMVFLPGEESLLLYGGWTGENVSGKTWTWNGEWTLVSDSGQNAGSGPPPRSAFGMTYNAARKRVEVYGGLWINGQYADAWAWNEGRWHSLTGPYDNSSLDHHAMFYDQPTGQTLVFGGKDYRYMMRGETRLLSSGGLVEVLDGAGPGPRHSVKVAYDTRRNRGVLFGGKVYQGSEQLPLGDMWMWESGAWREISSRGSVPQ